MPSVVARGVRNIILAPAADWFLDGSIAVAEPAVAGRARLEALQRRDSAAVSTHIARIDRLHNVLHSEW